LTTTQTTPISVHGLTKQFGRIRAVEELTFEVRPGQITGFLGPNGAGKTTTLRMLLGLVRPTAGAALIGGRPYPSLPHPRRTVGAVLKATGAHPGRTGAGPWRLLRPRCTATLRGEGYAPVRTGAASLATRSVSATASIWTILPSAMVKANTA
jgi:energy-coupling factor transporter ATP-binding protein EcfA2